MANETSDLFSTLFLSSKQKELQKINNATKGAGEQIRADLLLSDLLQSGATLDAEQPEKLKQFICAIDNLVQLKLTGCHTVTLYDQRLELHFNTKSNLSSIKLI